MTFSKKAFFISILLLGFSVLSFAQKHEKQYDKMLGEQFSPDGPGATALVAIDGKIIYHKAFGIANLELEVPMRPEMVFEIGSITKQFTAVSILMLVEQGKIDLDDDITKYIEDYPTHGHHISIHHLLTHTSGIKSYTSLESWTNLWRNDYEPLELIDLFKNEPMDFAPGEEFRYNNSAYFILGYVIEKASGMSYEQFVESNIFEPLGMHTAQYGSKSDIIKNRASGYQKQDDYVNAEYLSLTQPYAAGSIMMSVEDLFIWNRAILSNTLVTIESIELAYTNYTLNNGEPINYGYGWSLNEINGSPTIEHGGGIFGYLTNAIYLPDEGVFVAVFSNCNCNAPATVSTKMAAMAINKAYPDQQDAVSVDSKYLKSLVGVYDFEDGSSRIITFEDQQLYSMRTGGSKIKISLGRNNIFFYEDSFATIEFQEDGEEMIATFTNRINKTEGTKTDKPIPEHIEIQLDQEILKQYVGVYEIQPGFDITVRLEDGKLMSQATGQEEFQIFPESPTLFFLKVVDAQIEFIESPEGSFDSFILYQGGQKIPGKRK